MKFAFDTMLFHEALDVLEANEIHQTMPEDHCDSILWSSGIRQ